MTAEVVVMNTQAVAMAADSAATASNSKIFNSANKLFALSKHHPIGVLIYNNSAFMGIPWETLVKLFRQELGTASFPSVQDYADRFFEFLIQHPWFDEARQNYHVTGVLTGFVVNKVLKNILARIGEIVSGSGSISDAKVAQIVHETIRDVHDEWESIPALPGITDLRTTLDEFKIRHEKQIDESIGAIFGGLVQADEDRELLRTLAAFLFLKDKFSDDCSGIVIAGFGDIDPFPSVVSFNVEGLVDGIFKHRCEKTTAISLPDNPAAILPFAQRDVVDTFLDGIDPRLANRLKESVQTAFNDVLDGVLNGLGTLTGPEEQKTELANRLREQANEAVERCVQAVDGFKYESYQVPVSQVVTHLPKDELARMAETLVNITLFRRHVTPSAETVGGAIDVAVITKGDGFVWIERKHYFRPELNHHFFKNYFRHGGRQDD